MRVRVQPTTWPSVGVGPAMTTEQSREMQDDVELTEQGAENNDGLAAIAILTVTVGLIILVAVLLL